MKERPFLGVDLDNVLSQTDLCVRRILLERLGVDSRQEEIVTFDYHKCLPITREQEREALAVLHGQCDTLLTVNGSVEAVNRLSSQWRIWIVTRRPAETRALTEKWLHGVGITYERLLYSGSKETMRGPFRYLVDDNAQTAEVFAQGGGTSILLGYPWNASYRHHPSTLRLNDWEQIEQYLRIAAS